MATDRPIYELIPEAIASLQSPFKVADIVGWFAVAYPEVNPNTLRALTTGLTANHPSRHHYWVSTKPPRLFRQEDGWLVPYDPPIHGHFVDPPAGNGDDEQPWDGPAPEEVTPAQAEFVLESQLETFLVGNWQHIGWGRSLEIWRGPNGETGHQFDTGVVGRLDFLCRDTENGSLVVVELKRGKPSDRVVGQTARYMGWVRTHLAAPGQAVDGLIVAHESDNNLRYAASAVPGLRLLTYQMTFALQPVREPADHVEADVVGNEAGS